MQTKSGEKRQLNFTIRPEEMEGFHRRLSSDPALKNIVMKNIKNVKVDASIEYSIIKQSNSIVDCFGIPESGKSTIQKIVGYKLYHQIIKFGYKAKLELTFNYVATIHRIWKYFKDENRDPDEILIIQQDEQNELSGPESRSYRKQINNLLKTMRKAQVFVLFASPDDVTLSVCNMKIEAIAKDEGNRLNWAIYYVPIRKSTKKLVFEPSGTLLLEYTEEIERWYDERMNYDELKMEYIMEIINNRGMQSVAIPFDIIEDNANQLLERAKKIGIRNKSQMESLAKTMGLGTTTITEASVDHAKLLWDIWQEEQREKKAALLDKEKSIKQEEQEKRIRRLVVDVAEELYSEFNFMDGDFKSQSQIVKGWVMDNYRGDWTDLMPHVSSMWYLAKYWQFSNLPKVDESKITEQLQVARSDVDRLRTAFEKAVFMRHKNALLAQRAAYLCVQNPGKSHDEWTKANASTEMRASLNKKNLKDSTFRQYWVQHSDDEESIRRNGKIWGDAGELYFAYMIRSIVKKGKTEGWLPASLAIDSPCAAEERTSASAAVTTTGNESQLAIYDVEVKINGVSMAAINVKFHRLDNQSFHLSPEYQHHNPWLFLIDKYDLQEFLIPAESGKQYLTIHEGNRSQSLGVEAFVRLQVESYLQEYGDVGPDDQPGAVPQGTQTNSAAQT